MLPAIPDGVVAGAAAFWAMTAAVGVLRIARSCRALGRLKRASSPFDRSREARLPLWAAARDGGHRAAELRTSDCMTGACALGLGRPVILVSRSVADALSDESLDEIVMHEQAHLDRYDDWSQLLQAVVGSLAGLHPAVRFLARRLDVDREAACDDRVVSRTGATRRYASSLLTVAAASNPEAGASSSPGVPTATTTASALRVRVGRLLDPRRDRDARLARATSLVSVTALALAVVMSTQVAPVVVFLEAAGVNVPAAPAAPAIDVRRAPETAAPAITNVNATAKPRRWRPGAHPGHVPTQEPPAPSEAPQLTIRRVADPTPDAPPTAPLDSRIIAVHGNASVPVPLPSMQPASIVADADRCTLGSRHDLHDVCRRRCRARRGGDRRPRPECRRLNRPFRDTRQQSRRERFLASSHFLVRSCGIFALLVEAPLCVCFWSTRVMCRSARL